MIRYRVLRISILVLASLSISKFEGQNKICGTWLTADKKSHVTISKLGDGYIGRVTWILDSIDPSTGKLWTDVHNPDSNLRGRKVLGLKIMENFKYDKSSRRYRGGSLYFPRNGKTYRGQIWLINDTTLYMRGYFLIFYQTDVWTRVSGK